MTTVQKDSVITCLEEYVTRTGNDVGYYMLYADPNGSGLNPEKQETLVPLYQRIQELNRTGVYPYEGTEKPLLSVSIQTRVRHTISELMALHEIVGLIRTWIVVHDAKGSKWPPKAPVIPGIVPVKSRFPEIKMQLIRSLKSSINEALIKDLPTLIDEVYRAKYKSSGTFSYSKAETKFYTVKVDFLKVSLAWIANTVINIQPAGTILNPNDVLFPNSNISRESIIWNDWYVYSYSKQRDNHKFAPYYEKLCSAVCARLGKLKYAAPGSEDANPLQLQFGMDLLNQVGFNAELYKDAKKKLFQVKLYEYFMTYVQKVYERSDAYGNDNIPQKRMFITTEINKMIGTIKNYAENLDIEQGLVYLDVFSLDKSFYTKQDFINILNAYSQTGICNERIINAITKFISNWSLLNNGFSRKQMDFAIESVIVQQADFSKIKITSPTDPSIVFSKPALALMEPHVRARFEHLVDKNHPEAVGYVQKGVMSWTAALKTGEKDGSNNDKYDVPQGLTEDKLRMYANELAEIATIYHDMINPTLEARKKVISDNEKTIKRHKQWGVGAIGVGAQSPSAQYFTAQPNYYVPAGQSPGQGVSTVFQNQQFVPQQPPVYVSEPAVTYQGLPNPQAMAEIPAPDQPMTHHQVHPHVIHQVQAPVINSVVPDHLSAVKVPTNVGGMFGATSPTQLGGGGMFGVASPSKQQLGGLGFGTAPAVMQTHTPTSSAPKVGATSPTQLGGGMFSGVASPPKSGGGMFSSENLQPIARGSTSPSQVGGGLFGGGGL
jgi:hypothetical protein